MATYRIHAEVTVGCYADVEARTAHEATEKAKKFAHVVTITSPQHWGDEPAFFVDADEMDGEATEFRPERLPGQPPEPRAKPKKKGG